MEPIQLRNGCPITKTNTQKYALGNLEAVTQSNLKRSIYLYGTEAKTHELNNFAFLQLYLGQLLTPAAGLGGNPNPVGFSFHGLDWFQTTGTSNNYWWCSRRKDRFYGLGIDDFSWMLPWWRPNQGATYRLQQRLIWLSIHRSPPQVCWPAMQLKRGAIEFPNIFEDATLYIGYLHPIPLTAATAAATAG